MAGVLANISARDIVMGDMLGKGKFGVVYQARYAGEKVAVKLVLSRRPLARYPGVLNGSPIANHPSIVRLIGIVDFGNHRNGIVMEYLPLGSLDSFLRKQWQTLTKKDLLRFCASAASGLVFLANRKIVHRDIAARNYLVTMKTTKNGGSHYTLKLTDFGFSRTDNYQMEQSTVSVPWTAPEVLTRNQPASFASDCWSFGIVLWEIWTMATVPYSEIRTEAELIHKLYAGYRLSSPPECPVEIIQVMADCWRQEPFRRPDIQSVSARLQEIKKKCKPPSSGGQQRQQQQQSSPVPALTASTPTSVSNDFPLAKKTDLEARLDRMRRLEEEERRLAKREKGCVTS